MVKQQAPRAAWPRRTVAAALALVALFFLLPLLAMGPEEPEGVPEATPEPTRPVEWTAASAPPVSGWDRGQSLRLLLSDGTVEELSMEEYLWGVVAAEMPASFQSEALKAQAVCARTYCVHQRQNAPDKHPQADVCADYTCCQAYLTREQAAAGWGAEAERYADKITQAVAETDGLLCLYEGEAIDAVFFSSTAGRTSAAAEVWGRDVPYLTAVDSPEGEEVPGWQTVVNFSPEEFARRFTEACPEADFSGRVEEWIGERETDASGAVRSIRIGGVEVSGGRARSILGLRSAHFTAQATEEEIELRVTGYGHGVGMSQYGANAMAAEGKDFREILGWYYTGTEVGTAAS